MDPNRAWQDMASAVADGDWQAAEEAALALAEWLGRGGFPPRITGREAFDRLVASSTCDAIRAWEVA